MDELVGRCEASIKNWLETGGERSEAAKKSLLHLIKENPKNSLPRRYLARLLFHEAAGAISPGTVASNSSLQRIQLLTDAYEHAAVATGLSPNSLSCAALRATLAINLLVEESALLTPSPSAPAPQLAGASSSSGGGKSNKAASEQQQQQQPATSHCATLDRKCQELLQRFLGSIDACKVALEHPNPVLREPLITFTTATHTTCDPCSLLVEKIMDCSRAGKLQEVVAEKRSVLTSMQQVLQSCYALLDSTQVPLHSIIRLLQHILRPYGAEQQMLASSRVSTGSFAGAAGSPGSTSSSSNPVSQLPASQLHHAAIGELLRLLRPGNNPACPGTTAAGAAAATAAAAASTAVSSAAAAAAATAAAAGAPASISCDANMSVPAADADLAPLPLSVEKPWEPPSTAAGSTGSKGGASHARGAAKGRAGRNRAPGAAANAGKKRERSRRERFMDVESFWRSCSPQQRLQLLRVPLAPLLAGVKQESGATAAEVLMEGLVLLREQEHSSCYWLCAACDRKFHTARDFTSHLETCHEQLVLAKPQAQHPALKAAAAPAGASGGPGKGPLPGPVQPQQPLLPFSSSSLPPPVSYVSCGKCQVPVVGNYYTRTPAHKQNPPLPAPAPGEEEAYERMRTLCIKCYRELAALMGEAGADRSYSRVIPHAPNSPHSGWSDCGSDFISTRDSFSSCGDEATSSGGLSDGEPAVAAAAAAAAGIAQLRQYDSGGRDSADISRAQQQPGQLCPDSKQQRFVPCSRPWKFQQQRALAWRSHRPCAAAGTSIRGTGLGCGALQQQQQQGHQQQQPGPLASSPGIFVFGSNHHSSTASAPSSSSMPQPGVAAGSSAASPVTSGAVNAVVSPADARLQQSLPANSTTALAQQQVEASSNLVAYWQQQQLLLCSTDAAAAELLDGLDLVQAAKQLDNKPLRPAATNLAARNLTAGSAVPHGHVFLPGPGQVTGTKRPAPSACVAQVTAGLVGAGGSAAAAAGQSGLSQIPPAISTGSPVEGAGAAVCVSEHLGREADDGPGAGADVGTPSAANSSWRDWLLPKKLLQWNDDEAEALEGEGAASDGELSEDVTLQGSDQGPARRGRAASSRPSAAYAGSGSATGDIHAGSSSDPGQAAVAAAGAACSGGSSSSSRSNCVQQRPGRPVPTVAVGLGDDQAAPHTVDVAGAAPRSAPCSPRTPSAHDGWRAGADAAASSNATLTGGDGTSAVTATCGGDQGSSMPPPRSATNANQGLAAGSASGGSVAAAAAAAAAGAVDSLGACLAAAAPGVLVDEMMRCLQHLYDTDADVADETLLCLVDFLQRKLNPKACRRINCDAAAAAVVQASRRASSTLQLQQVSTSAAAAAAAVGLSADEMALVAELLSAPELAFLCPLATRAALCCLSGSDLQMALAYIVRQAGAPLACVSADIDSTCGSSVGCCSVASSSGGGSVTGDEDLGDTASHSDSQELDEESGCMSLFQLYHLDEVAFEQLVSQLWPGEGLDASSNTAAAADTSSAPVKAASAGRKQMRASMQQQGGKAAAATPNRCAASSKALCDPDRKEPVLLVSAWWLEHLRQSSKSKDPPGDAEADLRVLRWVYGNIESAQAEEFGSRQASLRGGLDRTAALLGLYEGLADAWRRMQRVSDRQRRLEQLRGRVKAKFAEVKALEEAAQHGSSQQAAAFLDALQHSLISTAPPAAAPALPAPQPGTSPACDGATGSTASAAGTTEQQQQQPTGQEAASSATPTQQQQPTGQQAAQAAAAAAVALSPLMQLTTYMTKLAPLYLCDAAVAAVRAAPLLASEASQQYACALLERELAVLALMEAKLEHDVAVARQRLQAANDRLLAKRGSELAAAEAEQAKLIAEGPASHRKKDMLDKATKETEHRQKLADVKARIEASKAAIAEDEALAASAELAAAEGTAALLHVQDLARQMNMRLKTLQDFNAQLAALLPPQHMAAAAGAGAGQVGHLRGGGGGAAAGSSRWTSSSGSAAYGSPTSHSMDSSISSNSPQAEGAPAAAPGAVASSGLAEAHAEWSLRARRLECLMCRVLWVAETIRLFDGQYDTTSVTGNSSAGAGPVMGAPALPAPPAAAMQGSTGAALSGPNNFSQSRTTPGDMLAASRWVKEQGEELDTNFHAAAEELGLMRSRIQQLACVDLTFDIHEAALNYARRRIEAAAAAAQEMRSQQLLLELAAEEEAAKKAAAVGSGKQQQAQHLQPPHSSAAAALEAADKGPVSTAAAGTGAAAATGQKSTKGKKGKQESKPAASKATSKASGKQQDTQAAEQQAKKEAAERQQALEAARAAREAAIEAELEKRRQELLALEEAAEAELIRLAEEASLKEQQALKEAAEKECQRREQQAQAAVAAAAAAASTTPAASPKQQHVAVSTSAGAQQAKAAGNGGTKGQQLGKQAAAAAVAATNVKSPHTPAGSVAADSHAAGQTGLVRPAAQRGAVQLTGPAAGKQAGKSAAARPAGPSTNAAASSAATSVGPGSTKRQQQQQQAAAGASGPPAAGKKGSRGGQAAAGNGRAAKGQPGSANSTPSKQQRKQQERAQQQAQQQQQQPVPLLLDFGPTPAEAYAAKQMVKSTQPKHEGLGNDDALATADSSSTQQEHQLLSNQGSQLQEEHQHQQHTGHVLSAEQVSRLSPVQSPGAPAAAAADGVTPSAPGPAAGLSQDAFGLTAADAVVHMPVSTANSSSHLALLSQHSQDGLGQLSSTGGVEPRSLFEGSAAPGSSAFSSSAAVAASSTQPFTADTPLTGFSPAPGGHLLSLGSGNPQLQPSASDAATLAVSGPSSLISGLRTSTQGYGSQDLGLGLGLGSFPASRQGSTGLQGPERNPGSSGFAAVGPNGAAALMLGSVAPAVSAAGAGSAQGTTTGAEHLLPPLPSLGTGVRDGLLCVGASAGLDAASGMFPTVGTAGQGAQLPAGFGGEGGGFERLSMQYGCSPPEDVPHIQSIMSLLDESATPHSTASPAPAVSSTVGRSAPGNGKGSRQQSRQQQQQQQQPQRQQQRQQRQQRQHQQQRPPSRGRGSPGPGTDAKAAAGARAEVFHGQQPNSSSTGDASQQSAGSSSASSASTVASPLRPPGLSGISTASLSSRPSSAGSSSAAAAGEGLGAGLPRHHQQQQQQHPLHGLQAGAGHLWGAGQGYAGNTGWAGADVGASNSNASSAMGRGGGYTAAAAGGGGRMPQGAFAAADAPKSARGADGGAAAAAASGSMWSVTGAAAAALHKADTAGARDQHRALSAGLGGYPGTAQANNAHAHLAAATAAAAAAAAATAAVNQAKQQAVVAAAAAAAGSQGSGMRARSPHVSGFYPQGHHDIAALFGNSSGLLGTGSSMGTGLSTSQGYFDAVGGFGGLAGSGGGGSGGGGLSGGLGAAHAAAVAGAGSGGALSGFGDVSGLWQQQQQQAVAMRYAGGLQQPLQQDQQQQLWSRPPSAGGGHNVQW